MDKKTENNEKKRENFEHLFVVFFKHFLKQWKSEKRRKNEKDVLYF